MELLEWIFNFINSPYGGAVPCALLGLGAQLFAYKGMSLNKATGKKADEFISEGIGYLVTISIALLLLFFVNNNFLMFLMNISISIGVHVMWARWIDPKLKNMAKNKVK